MTRRTLAPAAAILLAVVVAATVVALGSSGHHSLQQRVTAVAQGLKCPTCAGESVAASNTPIAQGMRQQIRSQLSRGRSPAQIRDWFEQRYGPQVLMVPPTQGTGLLLWSVPVLALLGGGALWATAHRRRPPGAQRPRGPAAARRGVPLSPRRVGVAAVALVAAGTAVPVTVWARSGSNDTQPVAAATNPQPTRSAQDWVAVGSSLEQQQNYRAAARAYRKALAAQPGSDELRTRLAFDLLRSDQPAAAARTAGPVARKPGDYRPLGLLVLGLAQRKQGDPAADRTLRRFLQVAPQHPAAAQVRRLLGDHS